MKNQKIIGWKEVIDLPAWGLHHVTAKADTGARRSAIDVKNLKELPDGQVSFDVVIDRRDKVKTRNIVARISHQTHVRSSNGLSHERYFVTTTIRLGNHEKEVEFSLTCRKAMVCRVLLGRKALEGDFLVDSSTKFVVGPKKKPKLLTRSHK